MTHKNMDERLNDMAGISYWKIEDEKPYTDDWEDAFLIEDTVNGQDRRLGYAGHVYNTSGDVSTFVFRLLNEYHFLRIVNTRIVKFEDVWDIEESEKEKGGDKKCHST